MRAVWAVRAVCLFVCVTAGGLGAVPARAAPVKICVKVQIKTYRQRPPAPRPSRLRKAPPVRPPARRPAVIPSRTAPTVPGATGAGQPGTPVARRPAAKPKDWRNPFSLARRRPAPRPVDSSRWRRHRSWGRSPYPYPPQAYLRRLVEHFVTHNRGYVAVPRGCSARISIEMYPLRGGWTVFARYSRRAAEEKVDRLEFGEFSRFAERVVGALLHGKDMASTANLRTILKADSLRKYRTIKGTHHFTFSLGAAPKLAYLPTYDSDLGGTGVRRQWRLLTPLTFALGYRGRFNAWGIDAFVRGGVGLQRESGVRNAQGGHVDLDGLFGVGLHFLRYHRPHGMISFYYGAGALFDLSFFSAITSQTYSSDRERFIGGGLNLNAIIGFEFMRASAAQFFIQLVASAPVYIIEVAPNAGPNSLRVRTYVPELAATVGIMF